MKQVLRYLGALKTSFLRLRPAPAPFRPDFQQTARRRQLAVARQAEDRDDTERLAVDFFAETLKSAGFLGAGEVAPVLADYAQNQAPWRDALLGEAAQLCRVGLPVYATTAGPLENGLDWTALSGLAQNDRLYQLRPHRFGFLPRLAIAASLGGDGLPALLATLDGWIAQAGTTGGAEDAYFSNLVVIYRLLAITWAAPFCVALARDGDRDATTVCLRLFEILAADVDYLRPRLGDSVANNHLLADRFAAWFLAVCYPDLLTQADDAALERDWLAELGCQFQADGTNFEQSVHYHELGCEMALAYLTVSLRRGRLPEAPALALIESMLRFQAALSDAGGHSFALGDATDDPLLPLDAGTGLAGGAWRLLYRALFDPAFPETGAAAQGAERAFWLRAALGPAELPLRRASLSVSAEGFAAFPDSGYFVLRDDHGDQQLLFRTGPRPGVEVRPGHAMADLLTVYLSAGGQPVLEPSGTCAYATEVPPGTAGPKRARDYFRSPAAHNGIVLPGHDPLGQPQGRFRGADNGTRVATNWRRLDRALAWVEGRLDEGGPLNGYRRGVLQVAGRYTLVYDRLPTLPEGAGAAVHWQCAPEVKATADEGGCVILDLPGFSGFSAYLSPGPGLSALDCVAGRSDPAAGWVSRHYGRLQAAPQVICSLAPQRRDLAFVLGVSEAGEPPPSVDLSPEGGEGVMLDVRQGGNRSIACIGNLAVDGDALPFDLDFQGVVLWLDIRGGRCRELRALGLRRLCSSGLGLNIVAGAAADVEPGRWRLLESWEDDAGLDGRWELRGDA